jgi:hypothetical protein
MTTPTLEETIRALAAKGEISDLGLSMNSTGTKWRASFVPCSQHGVSYAEDADPVKALILALSTIKVRRRALPTTDRELAADEAKATAKIDQTTVDADVEDLM